MVSAMWKKTKSHYPNVYKAAERENYKREIRSLLFDLVMDGFFYGIVYFGVNKLLLLAIG